ncbi:MAG: N-formylglutamate amidohydrolase [Flavobacteriales bacterium]|nr:N-formylglutamate amidohydrolase [Flavobacteriales bacterium]
MIRLLLTCEHGGHRVPSTYRQLFKGYEDTLASHRGWDIGALGLYRDLSHLADASFHSTTTRLLIEMNRSLHHPQLFSRFTRGLPGPEREHIIGTHYRPYRSAVGDMVGTWLRNGDRVVHVSVHSFTPVLDGSVRNMDIGLLYDPARKDEVHFARAWRAAMRSGPEVPVVRMNAPYRGTSDGLTTSLRRTHRQGYVGIELEVNQGHAVDGGRRMDRAITQCLERSLGHVLGRT